jgi:NAD(P)-dependent dehydrogenase (short-subunit alcohol dehydrogenase family)
VTAVGLDGTLVAIDHADGPVAAAIVSALRGARAHVEVMGGGAGAPSEAEVTWSRVAIVDAYVHVGPWSRVGAGTPLAELADGDFAALFDAPVRDLLWSLHAAHAHLARPGGRVVVVVPTAAMAGAPGYSATAAAAEAHRLLAKSVARQWGADGIRVNVVAVDLAVLAPTTPGLPPVSLAPPALGSGAVGDLAALGRLVTWLAAGDASALTGVTLSADGGIWMAP